MLDRAAFRLLRRRDVFAQFPERLALRQIRGDHGVVDDAVLHAALQDFLQRALALVARRRQFHQHVPVVLAGKGIADADAVTDGEVHCDRGDQLEGGQLAGGLAARDLQQLERRLRRLQPDKGGLDAARLGKQFQRRGGDDAERAFGADKQVAQIVAGIVLLQLRQAVEDAPVGQHHFEAERHLARHAVGERGGAAGIAGEVAADRAAAFGAERQRKQPVGFGRARLRVLQDHAGVHRHGVGRGVEVAQSVHPAQRQHDLAAIGRLAADEARIAALRHQSGARLAGELADRGDLRGRARPQHQGRGAAEQVAVLGDVLVHVGLGGNGVFVADDGGEARNGFRRKGRRRLVSDVHRASLRLSSCSCFRPRRAAAGH